jgi:hypothetical protein
MSKSSAMKSVAAIFFTIATNGILRVAAMLLQASGIHNASTPFRHFAGVVFLLATVLGIWFYKRAFVWRISAITIFALGSLVSVVGFLWAWHTDSIRLLVLNSIYLVGFAASIRFLLIASRKAPLATQPAAAAVETSTPAADP